MSTFHLFPQLAVELRLAIWRECLPYRTCEMDIPSGNIVFGLRYDDPPPCKLSDTTYMNGRPPVISRVCRESRAVAFETGCFPGFSEDRPYWVSGTIVTWNAWEDSARDSVHLNWTPTYRADYISTGSPLYCLAWETTQMRRGGSMMISFLDHSGFHENSLSQMIDTLRRLPSWVIVVGVVVIHTDFRTAAATGLFGLLGDGRIQIVDVSDRARVNAFFDLGDKSECHIADELERTMKIDPFERLREHLHQHHITNSPDLRRGSVDSIEQRLREFIVKTFGSEEVVPPMRPAIMFRLCTRMCNHSGDTENNPSAASTTIRGGRGRGRGRGLARARGRGGL